METKEVDLKSVKDNVKGDESLIESKKFVYDSGWVHDTNSSNHPTPFEHNLNKIPCEMVIWFSADKVKVYPLTWSWDCNANGNPVTIEVSSENIVLNIWSGRCLHGVWDAA